MTEEQTETVEEQTETEEVIDHEALQDQRLEEESQRQISTWLEEKGIELSDDVQEEKQEEVQEEIAEPEPEPEPVAAEEPETPEPKAEVSKKFLEVAKRERELFRSSKTLRIKNKSTRSMSKSNKPSSEATTSAHLRNSADRMNKLPLRYSLSSLQIPSRRTLKRGSTNLRPRRHN